LNAPVRELARLDPVRLREEETVAQALSRLREEPVGERIVYFYVTDAEGRLVGVVPTRRLLLSDPWTRVGEVMVHPVFAVAETERIGAALEMLAARRLLALPVTDERGRLCGVLDVTSFAPTLFDLERRDIAEEIFQLMGLRIEQERNKTLWWVLKNRFPWLLMNIGSGILAAFIAEVFGTALKTVVAVAFFIPLVLTLAESVAMQTVTMSLQSLHLARQRGSRPERRVWQEWRVGLLLGGISGGIVALLTQGWLGLPWLTTVVAGALVAAGVIGAGFGYAVPRLLHRLELNPKIASGPAVLALTDLVALFCYLGLSALVLA
jgi:magnesium transporter